jgi:two-component system, NtrC family, sensor kinase
VADTTVETGRETNKRRRISSARLRLAVVIVVSVAITGIVASWLSLRLAGVDNVAGADVRQRVMLEVAVFAAIAAAAVMVLMDLLAWRLVHRPIQQLRQTIERVTAGDFSARAAGGTRDEIGDVAEGLNAMLAQLETLNDAMQLRIREATEEVQQRNQQLVDSYHRLFGLREQLASAEQLASVGQTAANVAHQVGTPLNLISGYVQLLKEELGPNTPHAARLAIIEEQIAKVTTTVRSLLDRSRPMGRKTRTTAGELVNRVVELMLPNLTAAHITHEIDAPAADTAILVDATNFELSLLNLMTNAMDAMPNGGMLRIRVFGGVNRVYIEISDTGHGIPDQLLPKIFEPWVSTKKPGRGTGLGLAIARDVVSAHGGTISVTSTVGVGTTFTIDLPSDAARDIGRAAS